MSKKLSRKQTLTNSSRTKRGLQILSQIEPINDLKEPSNNAQSLFWVKKKLNYLRKKVFDKRVKKGNRNYELVISGGQFEFYHMINVK